MEEAGYGRSRLWKKQVMEEAGYGRSRLWKKQVEEESMKVGLRREDALCRSKWCVGVDKIAAGLR